MAQPHVRDFYNLLNTPQLNVLVTPVKLIRLPGSEGLGNEGGGDRMASALKVAYVTTHGIH